MNQAYATVTWDQLHRDARTLAARLLPLSPFEGVVAVTRGGLIPAAIVARELNCRMIETVCIATYDGEAVRAPDVLKTPGHAGEGSGWLVIDDLVDTGSTARLVRAMLPAALFACLYAKPAGQALADHWVAEVPQATWILFPWDTAPLFVPPLVER